MKKQDRVKLYKKQTNSTNTSTGKKFKISAERVRQIINEKRKYELVMIKKTLKKYSDDMKKLNAEKLASEVKILSKPDRTKLMVGKRRIMIRFIRDKHKFSFDKIGTLLHRDRHSIMNLYYHEAVF